MEPIRPAHIILITGPPCSGKTTYAEQHRSPNDLVLDYDTIARELGSPVQWLHPQPYRDQAEQAMRQAMNQLPGTDPGTAWIIRTCPTPKARAFLTRITHAAQTLVLKPGRAACIARAQDRPPATIQHIHDWYADYRPWKHDTLITHNTDPDPKPW